MNRQCNAALSRSMVLATLLVAGSLAAPASARAASSVGGTISRSEVISRAQYWVKKKVPYSMNATAADPQGRKYRTDCSGMVSMALHLGTSASTVSLTSYVTAISWSSLKPGDVVGTLGSGTQGANGHVVIFNGWYNSAHTVFRTLEEKGSTGAVASTRSINFKVGTHVAKPYRYKKISG